MKIKYIGKDNFLTIGNIYTVLGMLLDSNGYSYLVKDDMEKFRLWDSDDFEIIDVETDTSRWVFYNSPAFDSDFKDWEMQYKIDSFLFFGDKVATLKKILDIYVWENCYSHELLCAYKDYYAKN